MARPPKLRKKKVGKHTYWCTKTGGKLVYFGTIKEVGRQDAEMAFADHLKAIAQGEQVAPTATDISVAQLVDEYLAWSAGQFSKCNCENKRSSLNRWINHDVSTGVYGQGKRVGELPAAKIAAKHLNDFIDCRRKQPATAGRGTGKDKPAKPIGPNALAGDMQQIKACFNWGADQGRLPLDFRPFAHVPRVPVPPRPKHDSELLTKEEIKALLAFADQDLDSVRGDDGRMRSKKAAELRTGADNPYVGFADMLRLYHGLGCRTSELACIQVKHVDFRKCQVVVRHKRELTMADPVPRVLTLNDAELAIFKLHCRGKSPDDFVFTQPGGQAWCQDRLNERFKKVRDIAGVRDTITIYSYRHLWISEAIEADVPLATIAEMAGTSVKQIEATYGHIRHSHRSDARSRLDSYRKKRQRS